MNIAETIVKVLSTILFDAADRLRSGWRFLVYAFGIICLGFVLAGIAGAILYALSLSEGPATPIISFSMLTAAALFVGWLCGKYLEKLPFRTLGAAFADRWLRNLVIGLVLGGLTFGLAAGLGVLSGGLSFRFNSDADTSAILSTLAVSFLIFLAGAAFEEALFRGYPLQTFTRSNLTWFGVLLTSLLFATVHNSNPAANILSWTNTFIAGIWFAAAYLKTRDLWFPFGLHLAWNWVQGPIFGIEVSGLTEIVKAPLMRETDTGPAWITGGDYGVEGGVITTIALIVSTAVIYIWPKALPPE